MEDTNNKDETNNTDETNSTDADTAGTPTEIRQVRQIIVREPANIFNLKVLKYGSFKYFILQGIFMASALVYAVATLDILFTLLSSDLSTYPYDPTRLGQVMILVYAFCGILGRQLAFIHPPILRLRLRPIDRLVNSTENSALMGAILLFIFPTRFAWYLLQFGLILNALPSILKAGIFLHSEVDRKKLSE